MSRARNYVLGCRLGRRERQVLDYTTSAAVNGQVPSYGMICNELGIGSRSNVHHIVVGLERKGLLRREGSGRERRIKLETET